LAKPMTSGRLRRRAAAAGQSLLYGIILLGLAVLLIHKSVSAAGAATVRK